MSLRRTISKARVNESEVRYKVRLEDDVCTPDSQESRFHQLRLLRTLVETPDLLTCGPGPFKKLTIQHDGEKWVCDVEALVEEQSEPKDAARKPGGDHIA